MGRKCVREEVEGFCLQPVSPESMGEDEDRDARFSLQHSSFAVGCSLQAFFSILDFWAQACDYVRWDGQCHKGSVLARQPRPGR